MIPWGLELMERCGDCQLRENHPFCNLSAVTLRAFQEIVHRYLYPQNTVLFCEGQPSRGAFILCQGRAKLSINAKNGKSLMRVTEPGELLGLNAVISGQPYEISAEMLNDGQVNFIAREAFLKFLREHADASLRVAQILSQNYYVVCDQIRSLALSESVAEKLAKLLLRWCARDGKETERGIHLKVTLTHGEMAQMIGTTRETVTRTLGQFRSKRMIGLHGSSLYIQNKTALERIVKS